MGGGGGGGRGLDNSKERHRLLSSPGGLSDDDGGGGGGGGDDDRRRPNRPTRTRAPSASRATSTAVRRAHSPPPPPLPHQSFSTSSPSSSLKHRRSPGSPPEKRPPARERGSSSVSLSRASTAVRDSVSSSRDSRKGSLISPLEAIRQGARGKDVEDGRDEKEGDANNDAASVEDDDDANDAYYDDRRRSSTQSDRLPSSRKPRPSSINLSARRQQSNNKGKGRAVTIDDGDRTRYYDNDDDENGRAGPAGASSESEEDGDEFDDDDEEMDYEIRGPGYDIRFQEPRGRGDGMSRPRGFAGMDRRGVYPSQPIYQPPYPWPPSKKPSLYPHEICIQHGPECGRRKVDRALTVGEMILLNQADYRRQFFSLLLCCNLATVWAILVVRLSLRGDQAAFARVSLPSSVLAACFLNVLGGLVTLFLHSANMIAMRHVVGRFFWLSSLIMLAPVVLALLMAWSISWDLPPPPVVVVAAAAAAAPAQAGR